jgi:hypothetical protein
MRSSPSDACAAIRVADLAEGDAAYHPVRVGVPQAREEPAQLVLDRRLDRDAGSRTEQHRREVLDVSARERAHDVLGDERLRGGAEGSEIAEPREQHQLGPQRAARGRHHEDLTKLAEEHAAQREFANRAAEAAVDRCGRARRVDVAEHPEYERACLCCDDAAARETQFEHAHATGHVRVCAHGVARLRVGGPADPPPWRAPPARR